jgi:hypothetical protein
MSPPWVGAAGKSRHRSQRGSRLPPKDVEEGGLDCTDPSLEGAEARGVTRGGYDTMVSQWVRTADRTDASADSRGAPWSPGEITSAGRGNGSGRLTGLGRAVGKPHAPHGHVRQRDDGEAGHAGRIARFGRYTGVASLAARQAEANRRGFPRFRFPHAVGEAWETRGGKRYRAGGEVAGGSATDPALRDEIGEDPAERRGADPARAPELGHRERCGRLRERALDSILLRKRGGLVNGWADGW